MLQLSRLWRPLESCAELLARQLPARERRQRLPAPCPPAVLLSAPAVSAREELKGTGSSGPPGRKLSSGECAGCLEAGPQSSPRHVAARTSTKRIRFLWSLPRLSQLLTRISPRVARSCWVLMGSAAIASYTGRLYRARLEAYRLIAYNSFSVRLCSRLCTDLRSSRRQACTVRYYVPLSYPIGSQQI